MEETTQPSGIDQFWNSRIGATFAEMFTNPVQFLRVASFVAAFLGIANLIADMRALDAASDPVVWGTFFEDLLLTVVFVGVLHGLKTIVEAMRKGKEGG